MTATGPLALAKRTDSSRPRPLSESSRFFQRLQRRYAEVFLRLPQETPTREVLEQAYAILLEHFVEVGATLRVLRQWTLYRLIQLDCDQGASVETVTRCVTQLAEFALDKACFSAFQALDARHGEPLTLFGQRAQFWVIGMGKLGARELNVSSDIDLIYVFDEDGETAGTAEGLGRISVQEYFARAVKAIYSLVGDITEHGFVFRIDLALRPNGNSGPSVVSLGALEEYLLVQGRRVGTLCLDEESCRCTQGGCSKWFCSDLAVGGVAFCFQALPGTTTSLNLCEPCISKLEIMRPSEARVIQSAPTMSSCREAAYVKLNLRFNCSKWFEAGNFQSCERALR
jgi:hypothetical protein